MSQIKYDESRGEESRAEQRMMQQYYLHEHLQTIMVVLCCRQTCANLLAATAQEKREELQKAFAAANGVAHGWKCSTVYAHTDADTLTDLNSENWESRLDSHVFGCKPAQTIRQVDSYHRSITTGLGH